MTFHSPTLAPRGTFDRPVSAMGLVERAMPAAFEVQDQHATYDTRRAPGLSARLRSRIAHFRRVHANQPLIPQGRGASFFDGFLLLLAVCAMLMPTTTGYALATAAAESIVGLPFAVLMFFSPFALMALLPIRLIHLALHGLFGIRLRLGLLAPLSLVCLAVFLFLGPLGVKPVATAQAALPTPAASINS